MISIINIFKKVYNNFIFSHHLSSSSAETFVFSLPTFAEESSMSLRWGRLTETTSEKVRLTSQEMG